jgi:transitional endoplasmic reticulum ATPase
VFKGKQFGYRLKDEDGDYLKIPQITFLNLDKVITPIFPVHVEEQIEVSVYTPIEKTQRWTDAGLPLKRGVLLYGPFGTGKTLTSYTVAKKARENGWTFMVCDRPDEFPEILRLARNYEPCVVFCEDIDRVVSGRRTVEMDEILNILDGIESKGAQIMVVVTTNAYEDINKAMLRAGRLDARIHVPLPDESAVARLLRSYGGNMIAESEDLSAPSALLAGSVTASEVAEVITLAKGAAIANDDDLNGTISLTEKSLAYAARVVREQSDRSKEDKVENLSNQEKAAHVLAGAIERHIEAQQAATPAETVAETVTQ